MFSVHDKALHSLSAEPLSGAYPSTLVTLIYARGLQTPISTVRKHTETQHMLVALQSSDRLSSAQQGDNAETRGTGSSCGQPHHRGSSLSTSSAAVVGETLMLCLPSAPPRAAPTRVDKPFLPPGLLLLSCGWPHHTRSYQAP